MLRACSLILCLSFALAAPALAAPLEMPGARLAVAEYMEQARLLLKDGKAEEAWKMLSRLLREEPDNAQLNVLLTEAAFATGRDNQAIAAMERVVAAYPDNAQLRHALAKAYARAGDEAGYASEMQEALRLDPDIADEDQQYDLSKVAERQAARYDRFLAAGRLALGVLWDSNPTGGLDNLDLDIGPFTFRLHDDAGKKPSFGEYANGALNWSWRLGEDSPWYVGGDLGFYGKIYNRELPSNQHFTWGRASLGLRHVGAKHLFDIRGKIENAGYEPFESMTAKGGEASFVYALLPSFQLIARGGLENRLYMEHDEKDGTYWNAGLYGRLLINQGRHSLLGGVRYIGSSTGTDRWSYEGAEATLRLDMSFFHKLDISPFLGWRQTSYRDASTTLTKIFGEEDRTDYMYMAGIGFTWHWTEHLATEVGWQYVKNDSTSPFYRYDQHQINTGLVFSF